MDRTDARHETETAAEPPGVAAVLAGRLGAASEPSGWRPADAPRVRPLTYPGAWPPTSVLLGLEGSLRIVPEPDRPLSRARVVALPDDPTGPGPTLDEVLADLGAAPLAERVPVVAVGSNGSPAQLRHKFASVDTPLIIPMVQAEVAGLEVGAAAVVASYGAIPATPILGTTVVSPLMIKWLDRQMLDHLDATEPGYDRVTLRPPAVRATLPSGEVLSGCDAYLYRKGALVDVRATDGRLRRLPDQRTLIDELLAASAPLRELAGPTPESWVSAVRADPEVRRSLRRVFEQEDWIRHPAEQVGGKGAETRLYF